MEYRSDGENIRNIAYIGLGSNKGDKLKYLKKAVLKINEVENDRIVKTSSVYETRPFGIKEQENFFNAVIKLSTGKNFLELFDNLKSIEKEIGRKDSVRWGPREIDLDLLIFNDLIYSDEKVTIPHKGLADRDFVLTPLCEIEGQLVHPALNKKICDICVGVSEKFIIRKLSAKIL